MASCILKRVSNLGLDPALFLIDSNVFKLKGLPRFYQAVFKSWALFKCSSRKSSNSLYWLLNELLVHGARLDVSSGATPGLMAALCRTKILVLKQVVVVDALTDSQAVGSLLGIQSTRVVMKVLELWRQRLSGRERSLLMDYGRGTEPDSTDLFPEISITSQFGESGGPLLKEPNKLSLHTTVGPSKFRISNICICALCQ